MIVNRIGDVIRFALRARIKSADDSLQLGKFANHLRSQVALGKFRRAIGIRHVRLHQAAVEPLLGKPARNRAHAFHFVAVTSQPRFVRDAFEFRQIVGEPTFLIRLPKKLRIRQPRPQHSFVPGAHQPLRILRKIDDRQKMRRHFPVPLLHRKILLVPAHHRDQDLVRQRQVRWIEIAFEHARAFIEIGDQPQQFRVLVNPIPCPLCMRRQFFRNLLSALRRTNNHSVRLQLLLVVREVFHAQRSLAEKPVTQRRVPRCDSRKRKLQRLAIHHGDDPANRPNESRPINPRPRHRPRPRQIMNHSRKDLVQYLLRCPPSLHLLRGKVFALGSLHYIKVLQRKPLLLRKAMRRACRLADGIVSHRLRRPGHFVLHVGLFLAQAADMRDEPARRAESFYASLRQINSRRPAAFPRFARRSSSAFGNIPAGISSLPTSSNTSTLFSITFSLAGFIRAPRGAQQARQSVRDKPPQRGMPTFALVP